MRWKWTAILILALSLFPGCGIDSFKFLYAPEAKDIIEPLLGEEEFVFKHNALNSGNDFLGYELYYKFYKTDQETVLQADKSAIEDVTIPGTSTLLSRGFRRISGSPDIRPVLSIPIAFKSIEVEIIIDMSVDPFPGVSFSEAITLSSDLVREVVEEGETESVEKGFLGTDIIEGDSDVPAGYTDGTSIDMSVFVIAYGIDALDLREIYSNPAYLGYVRIS